MVILSPQNPQSGKPKQRPDVFPIDSFPKRHRLVHNGGFPKFKTLYFSQNIVNSTEISQNLGYKVQSSRSQSLKAIQILKQFLNIFAIVDQLPCYYA